MSRQEFMSELIKFIKKYEEETSDYIGMEVHFDDEDGFCFDSNRFVNKDSSYELLP